MIRPFSYNAIYGEKKSGFGCRKFSGSRAGDQACFKAGSDIEAVDHRNEFHAAACGDGHVRFVRQKPGANGGDSKSG